MALEEKKYDHLIELGGSDYEIVDGEPDIRGWKVKNEAGQLVGEVDDLLFDPQSQQVRYIIVDLKDAEFVVEEDKKVLAPIGLAALYDGKRIQASNDEAYLTPPVEPIDHSVVLTADELPTEVPATDYLYNPADDGEVVVISVTEDQLIRLPAYEKDGVDPETELSTRHVFEGTGDVGFIVSSHTYDPNEFYSHYHFDEEAFYNRGQQTENLPTDQAERTRRVAARYDKGTGHEPGTLDNNAL
ncbi:PRC-barrel domain-containing protein [Sphingobacterium sp.]|uniref:PRC-barrel domain-containing protein n=1 Tax=Sphingobacterium sp. TaxID=341027 RepID=UPI0028989C26|nr:PRC-barrel domain-containing protein [Sphingobacterium sp.]